MNCKTYGNKCYKNFVGNLSAKESKRIIIKVPVGNNYKWYQFCPKRRAKRISKERIRNFINMIRNTPNHIIFQTNEEFFIPVK